MYNFIDFNQKRKFGIEIEFNSFDGRDFRKNPLDKGEMPLGIDYIADLVNKNTDRNVKIDKYLFIV